MLYYLLVNNIRLSVTSDYDRFLAILFSVLATSEIFCVIRKDSKRTTCLMCEGLRWIFNAHTILLWYTWPSSLGHDPNDSAILELKLAECFLSIRHSWDLICLQHNWQSKPLPTALPWHYCGTIQTFTFQFHWFKISDISLTP